MRPLPAMLLAAALSCAGGCDNSATVNFTTGQQEFAVSASSLTLPNELRENDSAGPKVRSVPCSPMSACPSTEAVMVACERMVCDPTPTTVSAPIGDVVDLESGSDLDVLLKEVDFIEIREIDYAVSLNTLSVDVGELEIWWAPEGASSGQTQLGTVPALAARTTGSGMVDLDPAGNAELGDYLVSTSRRVRFFVRTRVDLRPGGAWPEGELTVGVVMSVTASGPLVD